MLYEYALEPALLNNWKDFRYFTEKFGFSEGRLISLFPKEWKSIVFTLLSECDARECSEIQLKRAETLLFEKDSADIIPFDNKILVRRYEWNPEKDWLTNAEIEHGKRPFRAILTKENPRSKDFVLEGDNIEDDAPLFHVEKTSITPRSDREMAELVRPVLQVAKEILLIDPHFGPENPRHRRPMKEFLAAAIRGRDVSALERVEIHLKAKAMSTFFRGEASKELPRLIPKGMKVRLVRWSERVPGEPFHKRYILTDRGGVGFKDGLDDRKKGGTDDVDRLGEETYRLRWKQYTSSIAFDKVDEIIILGEAASTQRRRRRIR